MVDKKVKKQQIRMLVNYYSNGNKSDFARKIGITPQGLSSWITRGTFDLEIIYSKCENISADWLLSGEGNMIKDEAISQNEVPNFVNAKLVQALADANKALSAANETILQQQEIIANHTNTTTYPPHAGSEAKLPLNPVDKK
ncbi:hypothetical protein [Alistipes finegoldii]|uniref:hypothetical protein n=1 Tax=Alistipes finegoldii TaxID=214856 RepID=UPI00242A6E81|nr:hypothetical protein [Alistipes finegoldii]